MRATAVIIKDNNVLLIHRLKDGLDYFVFPGGGIEEGESPEEAMIREIKEETNLDAKINKKLLEYDNENDKRKHCLFLITEFSGNLKLGGPEALKNSKQNSYILEWHNLDRISELQLFPQIVKEKLNLLL